MCGPDYGIIAELDEMEAEIEEKLLSLLKEWKDCISILDKSERTIAEWRIRFCSYVEEQLADFDERGRLNILISTDRACEHKNLTSKTVKGIGK